MLLYLGKVGSLCSNKGDCVSAMRDSHCSDNGTCACDIGYVPALQDTRCERCKYCIIVMCPSCMVLDNMENNHKILL